MKSRPRSDVEVRWGPCISNELGPDIGVQVSTYNTGGIWHTVFALWLVVNKNRENCVWPRAGGVLQGGSVNQILPKVTLPMTLPPFNLKLLGTGGPVVTRNRPENS